MPKPALIRSPLWSSVVVAVVMGVFLAGSLGAAWALTVREPGGAGEGEAKEVWVQGLRVRVPGGWELARQTEEETVFRSPGSEWLGGSLVIARLESEGAMSPKGIWELVSQVPGRQVVQPGLKPVMTAFPGVEPPRVELVWMQVAPLPSEELMWTLEAMAVVQASPTRFHVVLLSQTVDSTTPQRAFKELPGRLRRVYLGEDGRVGLR